MDNSKVFNMKFARTYPLLIAKAERKGRSKEEVYTLTSWLTGYSADEIQAHLDSDISYGDFFAGAPDAEANSALVKGTVCGVKVENIEDPFMRQVRALDKLVDDLAKGKTLDGIIPKVW